MKEEMKVNNVVCWHKSEILHSFNILGTLF